MLTTPNGTLSVQTAAASVPEHLVTRRVIAIRADHDAQFGGGAALRRAFGPDLEIVVLERETNGPAETVAVMIERARVEGSILIKDADSFFAPTAPPDQNFVAAVDLRRTLGLSRVGAKSFILLNEQGLVTSIVEKEVASNFVSAGLYGFAAASAFTSQFAAIRDLAAGEIFVSHVIAEGLRRGCIFRPYFVDGLIDVGTLDDWRGFTEKRRVLLCDIDGVVFKNQSAFFPPYWGEPPEPIAANVARLKQLQDDGAQLIFVTSRPETVRAVTLCALEAVGFSVHALVMGCAHAGRVLINDYADSNPYPSATAVNVARNQPELARLLP